MPTRIIEINWIDATLEPSLRVVSNPPDENYAALSYCWGDNQPVTAKDSSIQDLSQTIIFSELPKTLRDAIHLTWNLSLRLLWVDSLCVIQDSPDDVAREIALMPQIYQNAHITISAARSSSSRDGFLHNLEAPTMQGISFRLPFLTPNGILGSVLLLQETGGVHCYDPIERRAWPLQEFLLSRRVLKYGSYQMSWTCLIDEVYEIDDTIKDWWKEKDKRFSNLRKHFHHLTSGTISRRMVWEKIVTEYTSRDLSDSKDRLLAISGIAKTFGDTLPGSYLAGSWERDFPVTLLWQVVSFPLPRPHKYRAPSWSWASVDGSIRFLLEANLDPELRLLSCTATPVHSLAPYGAVKAGSIKLLGTLRRAT
jgi:hypothetical protein